MTSRYPIREPAICWLETILNERFGHVWHLARTVSGLSLTVDGGEGAIIFDTLQVAFTEARSDLPFTLWDAEREGWQSVLGGPLPAPGVAQLPPPLIEQRGGDHVIHYDIPGLTYWMLNRIEEIGRTDLDNHGRFPASASHAFKHDYLERPVVDEWLHILGQVIQRQWSSIKLAQHRFSIKVSHDVDRPSMYAFTPWKTIARMMAGHALKRRDLRAFLTAPYIKLATRGKLHAADPFNTFDWLMDVSESNQIKSVFYFICGRTSNMDADYEIEHPAMQELLKRIHLRGHEIGLHPSYGTYQSPELIKEEADRLRRACRKAGVTQSQFGGRMHYLRWEQPTTLKALLDAGLIYDTTLGYADRPGFRCGTCFEYPAIDLEKQEILGIRIRPLVVMEGSVISEDHLGFGTAAASQIIFLKLHKTCESVGGCYTLLWHNSSFIDDASRAVYLVLLNIATEKMQVNTSEHGND